MEFELRCAWNVKKNTLSTFPGEVEDQRALASNCRARTSLGRVRDRTY